MARNKNLYNEKVKWGQVHNVTTLAGGPWSDGPASEAKFFLPSGTAVDLLGNVYFTDLGNHRIRKISPAGVVTTLAGGKRGFADETGTAAMFSSPSGIAVDACGNVYVTEWDNNRIRKVSPDGVVSTLAGSETAGFADGIGTAASFNRPKGVAIDGDGNVYVADEYNNSIRKISPFGEVITLAGGSRGYADGTRSAAMFSSPNGVAVDVAGNVYVSDTNNHRIRKISPSGQVISLAGSVDENGEGGFDDGTGSAASFYQPYGIAVDGCGNVYVADHYNNCVRKINPYGVVTTLAGSGEYAYEDGTGTAASFFQPTDVAVDGAGNVYVADWFNHRIRKISPVGVVTTLTGSGKGGFADGLGTSASFSLPRGIAINTAGDIYVADENHCIRKISPVGEVTTIAGSGISGYADGAGTSAIFSSPSGISIDIAGNLYVADSGNHRIRKISPIGVVTTLAGSGIIGYANGKVMEASFNTPNGVAVDLAGNVYVADSGNHRIRKISPVGLVTTFAGEEEIDLIEFYDSIKDLLFTEIDITFSNVRNVSGYADGIGSAARFHQPTGVAVDCEGNVYVADQDNNRIRKINPEGNVTTLAGSGTKGYADGIGIETSFNRPFSISVDDAGNVYVTDTDNHCIRKISPNGMVSTLAGIGQDVFGGGDYFDGIGPEAGFYCPTGIAVDSVGIIYVADKYNDAIRQIIPTGYMS